METNNTLKCITCGNVGYWHVWYERDGEAMGYNTLCHEHAYDEMLHGRAGWGVACIKPVGKQFMPVGEKK